MTLPRGRVAIRNAVADDYQAICALNLAVVQHTSPMDMERLSTLGNLASCFKVACADGNVSAFLIAIPSGAAYENANFSWFARKYARFLYVDRVVVSSGLQGRRLGSLLYEELFRHAQENAIPLVTCEYNIVPPNEPSRLFHDTFGFTEQGTQWIANGTKRVSLQAAQTSPSGAEVTSGGA